MWERHGQGRDELGFNNIIRNAHAYTETNICQFLKEEWKKVFYQLVGRWSSCGLVLWTLPPVVNTGACFLRLYAV
jgi:hypothetical protein